MKATPHILLGLIVLFALMAGAVYVFHSEVIGTEPPPAWTLSHAPVRPYILFRSVKPDGNFGHVGFAQLSNINGLRSFTSLQCARFYYAGERGVCVRQSQAYGMHSEAVIFNAQFKEGPSIPLSGPPSRVRMSDDGHYGAITVFESGHLYTDAGFSTRTSIVDAIRQVSLGDLEQFAVTADGVALHRADFNFWGVTFKEGSTAFFASMSSAGIISLVEGDLGSRSLRVLRAGLECPSLSPDNQRIVFKKRGTDGSSVTWRLAVLDLVTGRERLVDAETRSVDDQVEWLDNDRVLYQMPKSTGADIWVADIAKGRSSLFLQDAMSPVVVR